MSMLPKVEIFAGLSEEEAGGALRGVLRDPATARAIRS